MTSLGGALQQSPPLRLRCDVWLCHNCIIVLAPNRFNNPDLIMPSSCWTVALGRLVVTLPEFQVLGDAFLCMLQQRAAQSIICRIFFFSALALPLPEASLPIQMDRTGKSCKARTTLRQATRR